MAAVEGHPTTLLLCPCGYASGRRIWRDCGKSCSVPNIKNSGRPLQDLGRYRTSKNRRTAHHQCLTVTRKNGETVEFEIDDLGAHAAKHARGGSALGPRSLLRAPNDLNGNCLLERRKPPATMRLPSLLRARDRSCQIRASELAVATRDPTLLQISKVFGPFVNVRLSCISSRIGALNSTSDYTDNLLLLYLEPMSVHRKGGRHIGSTA